MIRKAHLSRVATIEEYRDWLFDLIDKDSLSEDYTLLLRELFDTPFIWKVPNDDNRAFEGKNLRELFSDELNIEYNFDYFPEYCSMLELIIGLSYRCESMSEEGLSDYREWFWTLLNNCGLSRFDDDSYFIVGENSTIIINKLINRTYKRSGQGGFFPLKSTKKDQRKVELWYQMSAYLSELYYPRD